MKYVIRIVAVIHNIVGNRMANHRFVGSKRVMIWVFGSRGLCVNMNVHRKRACGVKHNTSWSKPKNIVRTYRGSSILILHGIF